MHLSKILSCFQTVTGRQLRKNLSVWARQEGREVQRGCWNWLYVFLRECSFGEEQYCTETCLNNCTEWIHSVPICPQHPVQSSKILPSLWNACINLLHKQVLCCSLATLGHSWYYHLMSISLKGNLQVHLHSFTVLFKPILHHKERTDILKNVSAVYSGGKLNSKKLLMTW